MKVGSKRYGNMYKHFGVLGMDLYMETLLSVGSMHNMLLSTQITLILNSMENGLTIP